MTEEQRSQKDRYSWLPSAAVGMILLALVIGGFILYSSAIVRPSREPFPPEQDLDHLYNAVFSWSLDHEDRFPTSFGPLLHYDADWESLPLDIELLVNPRLAKSAWPPPDRSAPTEELARWANEDAHYVLIEGAGRENYSPEQPLMYERPHPSLEGGLYVCYADGFVTFETWSQIIELLKQAGEPVPEWTEQRAKEGTIHHSS